jgi:hypothetical protein
VRNGLSIGLTMCALTLSACSQPTFLGTWKIERVEPAPWVEAGTAPDASIADLYVGKTVAFEAARIDGPALLACANPKYTFEEVPAEGLFQGNVGEPGEDAASADAAARKLGFTPPVHSMMTGCEHDIAFHQRDDTHAAFALDNMIFWMVRQP